MCKCCSSGKHASKYKQFEFLQGHTDDHDGVAHSHEHDHEHHHTHPANPKAVSPPIHGGEQESDKE